MALREMPRRRMPLDGTWVRSIARLDWIMRNIERNEASYNDDESKLPNLEGVRVPVWVSMQPDQSNYSRLENPYSREDPKHNRWAKGQSFPHGIIFRPVVRIGDFESREIEGLWDHNCGLVRNSALDGWQNHNQYHYEPYGYGDETPPGEFTSVYICDQCNKELQHDPNSERMHDSAIWTAPGRMACRECEAKGLVTYKESRAAIERCRKLADLIGGSGGKHREQFENQIKFLDDWRDYDRQVRIFPEDTFSFFWKETYLADDGTRKPGMHGGLIMHGPSVTIADDGSHVFSQYDYGQKAWRPATPKEVDGIRWGIHT